MKKLFLNIIFIIFGLFLISCSSQETFDIITTAYPQYDFAKNIVKDKMTVKLLIKPGEEIHKYEVTSKDRITINNAKLFIYTSDEIDVWFKNISSSNKSLVMNLSKNFVIPNYEFDEHDLIHYWVDPYIAIELIEAIYEQIILLDPNNKDYYFNNKDTYQKAIKNNINYLTNNLRTNEEIYFAGHNAFGLFSERFNLKIHSIHDDYKPDQDIVSNELINFINILKQKEITYLFIEELVEPLAALKIKSTLEKEGISINLLELHAYHNVSKEDFDNDITYNDIFLRNIENIFLAIGDSND